MSCNESVSSAESNNPLHSVRIGSPNVYGGGLFILDLMRMPYGCGVWPAYWSYGPNWPSGGMQLRLSFFIASEILHQGRSTSSKVSTMVLQII